MKNKRKSHKKKEQYQKGVMGGCSERSLQNGFCPNGLIVEEAASIARPLDPGRWDKAEKRTAELISRIQPNRPSENHRNAVASYVQRLVSSCVPCQVFTFGSVPLKTYLPDGDIDLSAFSEDQNLKNHWAEEVREMLLKEEKNEHAEFPIKEVQLIQAEVRIIKCLVDNIVVDISFNQLGGLCTLCFLEEVDNLISRNHLFKRSIVLIKAWCFYESRILGAHHGLISTYALETLVLYIFNVFNNSFAGPLEVLYRFLEFFSKFDWSNFCVSLWGPVPINSLPNMAAAPPRKDGGNLLLSQMFLDACSSAYSASTAGSERDMRFSSKHLNVVDPLRQNNNLGRSVNKGNFYRIRSAFSFGAQQLAKILVCPVEDIVPELDQFFANTWERHGKDCRTDSPFHDFDCCELEPNHSLAYSIQPGAAPCFPTTRTTDSYKDLNFPKPNYYDELRSQMASAANPHSNERSKLWKKQHDDIKRTCMMNILQTSGQPTRQFARTSSSPELTNMSGEASSSCRYDDTSSASGYSRRRIVLGTSENHVADRFTDETSIRESSSHDSIASGSDNSFGNCASKSGSRPTTPAISSVPEGPEPIQRFVEQDFVNKLSSAGIQHYGGHAQMPVNLAYSFAPFPPPIMKYNQQNNVGTIPINLPAVVSDCGTMMNHSNGSFSLPFHQPIQPPRNTPEQVLVTKGLNERAASPGVDHAEEDSSFWIDDHINRKIDPESEDLCTASSRFSPAPPSGSVRTKASSERSWDGKSTKMTNLSSYPLESNRSSTKNLDAPITNRWEENGESVHTCEDVNDERKDLVQISAPESFIPSVTTSHFEVNQMPGFEQPQISYQHSMSPFGPPFVHPGSQQGIVHNRAVWSYYQTGPSPSFVTMVPIYNLPAETESSTASTGHDNLDPSNQHEQLSQTNISHSKNVISYTEHRNECGSDIFNGDFARHWRNLNYARLCQGSQFGNPFPYPQLPSQGISSVVPVQGHQPVKPAGVSRQHGGEVPKQRNGTGTYIPNPLLQNMIRERQCLIPRQYEGGSAHDRNENYGYRDTNWNVVNLKPGFGGRGQPRNCYEKQTTRIDRSATSISQTDRTWDTSQENSNPLYCLSNRPSPSNSAQCVPDAVDYSVYQVNPEHSDKVSSPDDAFHPLVMPYPYPHPGDYGSWTENLQFGSVRPEEFVGTQVQEFNGYANGGAHDRQNFEGDLRSHSPDYASSPRFLSNGGV